MPAEFAPHDLTGYTSHSPFVVTVSSEVSVYLGFRVFDLTATGNNAWIGSGGGVDWVALDTGSGNAYLLASYQITAGGGTDNSARAVRDWTMEGSNDGSSWTVLDTRSGETGWGGETRTYTCSGVVTAYRHFRLNVTANNGDALTGMAELYLIGDLDTGLPAAIGISPSNGQQAQVLTVTVTGTDTSFDGSSAVSIDGTGITVGAVTVASGTSLDVELLIANDATISARTLTVATGSPAETATATFSVIAARGNIDYDQIRASARTGNGPQLLTYTFPPPATSSDAGTPGQISFDAAGNWYWCYDTDLWARIGPGGYSDSWS